MKANKISPNASKTEMLIFCHPNKTLNYDLKINLDGKRLYPSRYVKYLGILIDSHLNWSYHVELLAPKLSRAIGMLSKIRHFVQSDTLRTIYFGIFSSILMYGSQIWGNHHNIHLNRITKLQDKALRILNFAHYHAPTTPLYKNSKILKFRDNITLNNNFVFVHDSFKGILPHILNNNFVYLRNLHDHNIRISSQYHVKLHKSNTLIYGIKSITGQSARAWNYFQSKFDNLCYKSLRCCKKCNNTFLHYQLCNTIIISLNIITVAYSKNDLVHTLYDVINSTFSCFNSK